VGTAGRLLQLLRMQASEMGLSRHGRGLAFKPSAQEDLLPAAELPVKRCGIAKYSPSGGRFAAVGRANAILVYDVYAPAASTAGAGLYAWAAATGAQAAGGGSGSSSSSGSGGWAPAATLRGHVSSVTDVAWSADGRRLVSCGAGGAVYVWDPETGARLAGCEYIDKARVYTAGASCMHGRSSRVHALL
jgi:WD40 repeat protein